MDLIIKTGADEYFRKKLLKGEFGKDDLLLCNQSDEFANAFQKENVFFNEPGSKFSKAKRIAYLAKENGIRNIVFISDSQPTQIKKTGLLIAALMGSCHLRIDISGQIKDFSGLKVFGSIFMLIFSPLFSILLLPEFIFKEVLFNFILPEEFEDTPFIHIGKNKRLSGVIYWYAFIKRAIRHGYFGYAFNEYMGVPVSLFHFPLSMFMMSKIRFRGLFLSGMVILFLGMSILYFTGEGVGLIGLILVIPFYIVCNVVWEHASLGVYEILSWGFGVTALVLFLSGHGLFAGILIGLAVLSHLGAATLICAIIFILTIFQGFYLDFLITAVIAFLVSGFWFIPYFLNRQRVTRMKMINEEWGNKRKFGLARSIQFVVYLVFALTFIVHSKNIGFFIIVSFPLLIAYLNAKVKWLYSPYTVRMFQAITGMVCLSQEFNLLSFAIFLYFLYLPPSFLSWENHEDEFHFSLAQDNGNELIKKTGELFSVFEKNERLGFELGSKQSGRNLLYEDLSAFYSYFLMDKPSEVFNTPMIQLVKYDLYSDTCSKFNRSVEHDVLIDGIAKSGVTSIVAFSRKFKMHLERNGFTKKNEIEFQHHFKGTIRQVKPAIYKIPFVNDRSNPVAGIKVAKNQLVIRIPQDGDYVLKYSYTPALVCKQNGKKLTIMDDGTGRIKIFSAKEGEVVIGYSYLKLFRKPSRKKPVVGPL